MARPRTWGARRRHVRPPGQIRQSQVVTTNGPGSLVDLTDQAVLVGGLDFWSWDSKRGVREIAEPRLRDALAERFRDADRPLSTEAPFREPPAGDDKEPSRFCGIQVLEFPQWFVCQNPGCRALIRHDALELKGGRYLHRCDRGTPSEAVPVRFVGACRRGHLEDFPWLAFVHEMQRRERCPGPALRLLEGATGDFSEIEVRCACGASQKLSSALAEGVQPHCRGERPWLGREGREPCDERLRLLVRTASNAYFPQVVSALSIPEKGRELEAAVEGVWDVLKTATAETLPAFRTIDKVSAALRGWSDEEVLRAVAEIRRGAPVLREPLRTAEFRQLVAQKRETGGELPGPDQDFFARSFVPLEGLPSGISRLVLASKLREVRVQVGFTRLEPVTPDLEGEFDLEVQSAALGLTTDWLPASEVRGEGVFLELDEKRVLRWESRPAVLERGKRLLTGYEDWTRDMPKPPPFPGVRFYLLHSLSHLLLSAIALECGYAASALRERIYCAPADAETPMAGILLSTGTSGSEGTLGGLVEQGRKIGKHLGRALELGRLCSNDPVCAAHDPAGDPSERFLEGAACHGCLFIAECSCERFNRYLDRALVIPALGQPAELAYFSEPP